MDEQVQLSEQEAELYDRQIRLWGVKSQERLRAANVLLIHVGSLGSEIAKNILLSGINSLTLLDDGVVTKEDVNINFFLTPASIGEKIAEAVVPKAQALNPLVKLKSDTSNIDSKEAKFFASFSIVVATRLSRTQILEVSTACREYQVKFIYGDNLGMFAFSISDFDKYTFIEERPALTLGKKRSRPGGLNTETVTKTLRIEYIYPAIKDVLRVSETPAPKRRNVYFYLMQILLVFRERFKRNPHISSKEKDIEELMKMKQIVFKQCSLALQKLNDNVFNLLFGEIVPVCSVLGGIMSQEVIKAVSGREAPIFNVFLLDPITLSGREERVEV